MQISAADLSAEYVRARVAWPFISQDEITYGLPRMLLFAVGSRETNLTNEVGDSGHGHGVWQLDNRSHVIPAGFDQNVSLQCTTAALFLHTLINNFNGNIAAAVAAYNSGAGTVSYNLAHGLSVNAGTAGGNYSADVLARMNYLQTTYPASAAPAPETEDEPMDWIVVYENAQWVVAHDFSSRVIIATAADVGVLNGTGTYKLLPLSAAQMSKIPDLSVQ